MCLVIFKITNNKLLHLVLFLVVFQTVWADRISLEEDIADGYLNEYSKIEAAFILSGVTHTDSLPRYINWYEQALARVSSFDFDVNDPVGSARIVFLYLHTTWLKTYAKESTTLVDIVRNKEYNCVAATILFNIICEDLGWECEAFETPTHVYTIFKNFRQKVIVENTSSMGFDIMKNLKAYSKYLAQYYPESDVLRIGLHRLYFHENSKGRNITNTELLGLLAYNRAYLAKDKKDFKSAYEYVLLAQLFNEDSRSNINFEIGLYYTWGKQLFDNKSFMDAFSVFADGYYRYPDNEDFRKNTFTSFYNSLQINWHKKDWPQTAQLIDEMIALDVLQKKDHQQIKRLLYNWMQYYQYNKDVESGKEVARYLDKIGR